MRYEIRLAEERDIAQMVEITNREAERSAATVASADEPVSRWVQSYALVGEMYPWLVALDPKRGPEREVIGYAKATPYNVREGFRWSVVLSVYINPDYQGERIGHALYGRLFSLLTLQGYQRTYARIALPNIASQRLHERFGLTRTGVLPHFAWKFERWHDMAIYTGSIKSSEAQDRAPRERILSVREAVALLKD